MLVHKCIGDNDSLWFSNAIRRIIFLFQLVCSYIDDIREGLVRVVTRLPSDTQ